MANDETGYIPEAKAIDVALQVGKTAVQEFDASLEIGDKLSGEQVMGICLSVASIFWTNMILRCPGHSLPDAADLAAAMAEQFPSYYKLARDGRAPGWGHRKNEGGESDD